MAVKPAAASTAFVIIVLCHYANADLMFGTGSSRLEDAAASELNKIVEDKEWEY